MNYEIKEFILEPVVQIYLTRLSWCIYFYDY